MADGVKVGDAHVEVHANINERAWARNANTTAMFFGDEFARNLNNVMGRHRIVADIKYDEKVVDRSSRATAFRFLESFGRSFLEFSRALPTDTFVRAIATPFGSILVAVLSPVIVTAGITLGAMLGGGIVAGLGTVAFGGALFAAFQNVQVQTAAQELGGFISQKMGAGLVGFRQELIGTLGELRRGVEQLDFGQFFGRMSGLVSMFGDTLVRLAPQIDNIMQKIAQLAIPMGVVAAQFLEKLVPAVDRFVSKLGGSLPGLQSAFVFFGNVIIGVLDFVGDQLAHFGNMWEIIVTIVANALDVMADMAPALEAMGLLTGVSRDKLHEMADQMRESLVLTTDLNTRFGHLSTEGLGGMSTETDKASNSFRNLKQMMESLQGPAVTLNEMTERLSASQIALREHVNQAGNSLNIQTSTGLRNRDMLQQVITESAELALQEIATGGSIEVATQKHQDRINKLINELFQSQQTRDEARKLAEQYGKIPTDVRTILQAIGVKDVEAALLELRAKQVSLWKNISVSEAKANIQKGTYHTGGLIPGNREVDITALGGEYVIQPEAVKKYGVDFFASLNNMQAPARKGVGAGPPVRQDWIFPVDVSKTAVDKTWAEGPGLSGVAGSGGGPLGGWAGMFAWLAQQVPGIRLNSGYRPGSMAGGGYDYHHYGRAIDIGPSPGPLMIKAADAITRNYFSQTRELIHTPLGNRQIWNGRYHVFWGGGIPEGHYDHLHWAMDQGGGLMPGTSLVTNQTGRPEAILNPKHSALVGRILAGDALIVENHLYIDGQPIHAIAKQQVETRSAEDRRNDLSGRRL